MKNEVRGGGGGERKGPRVGSEFLCIYDTVTGNRYPQNKNGRITITLCKWNL